MSTMSIGIETITPQVAERYLQMNRRNRSVRPSEIEKNARMMAAGEWGLTHQGIAFNEDGALVDGQHRLLAIVKSGTTVPMVVARGVESSMQMFMDDHARRTPSDSLTVHRGEKVSSDDVAVLRAALSLSRGAFASAISKTELDRALDTFHDSLAFCRRFTQTKQRGVTSAPPFAAVALAWFYVPDLERLAQFCDMLVGNSLAKQECDNAAILVREWLLQIGVSSGGAARLKAFMKTQRAIVAFAECRPLHKLYGTNLYFPYPLVKPVRASSKEAIK